MTRLLLVLFVLATMTYSIVSLRVDGITLLGAVVFVLLAVKRESWT